MSPPLLKSDYPTYVVAPVLHSRPGHTDVKRLFAGLLSFYLGYEWIQTNNILVPM
ncbi:hypothetical protein LINPERPRIM_LOCUS9413, partial [Linum perenne]